jgi:hypothetical protein
MVKIIAQGVAQQLKQLREEVFEAVKKQPQELAGKALEQMGIGGSSAPGGPKLPQVSDEVRKIEEMKKADEETSRQLAAKIVQDLGVEIEKWRRIREQQLQARRGPLEQKKEEKKQEKVPPLLEPSAKPKQGLSNLPAGRHGFWGRRIKSAQQQAQPEMAGRRAGG